MKIFGWIVLFAFLIFCGYHLVSCIIEMPQNHTSYKPIYEDIVDSYDPYAKYEEEDRKAQEQYEWEQEHRIDNYDHLRMQQEDERPKDYYGRPDESYYYDDRDYNDEPSPEWEPEYDYDAEPPMPEYGGY